MNICEEIKKILVNEMGIEEDIKEDSVFFDDLGIDSIEIVELRKNINNKFNINIPINKMLECETIKEMALCVEEEVKKN